MSLGLFLWGFPVNFAGKDDGGGEEWVRVGKWGSVREKFLYLCENEKEKRIRWKGEMAGQRGRETFVNVWWGNKG